MKKNIIFFLLSILLQTINVHAQSTFRLIGNPGTYILYQGKEKVVNTALDILINDSRLVSEKGITRSTELQKNTIIVGISGKESEFDKLVSEFKIDVSDLEGKWEGYKIIATSRSGNSYLFVLGSDPRGTAYGILELSRQMGISPWVWWADVVPEKRSEVVIHTDGQVHAPSVQYRGIFLNDEDWALMPWSTRTFEPTPHKGAIGPQTYAKIFELLLRLRANTIWPAMHECTIPFFFVDGNKEMAEKYGIVLSTSHAEPMMRTNTGEWNSRNDGSFNFLTNRKQVLSYWEERVKQLTQIENIYTMGMRGIHDGRMQGVKTLDDETQLLHQVIDEQRKMLARNNPSKKLSDIPQIFVPYKEVLKAYDNGLKLPDDITLVWCDDNHGYIMRLSDEQEQKRSGGSGVYYHISYWGKPHDYLWLASTQPGLIYTEMKRAWDNGACRLWILNVGDIKPGEYLTEFFLDMAWNIDAFSGDNLLNHQREWINKTFGGVATDEIHAIMQQYYQLAAHRKPEHMGWNRVENKARAKIEDTEFSMENFGDEMERRINAYSHIALLSKKVYETKIPEQLKSAYFQLVYYPVAASGAMNRKILYAQKSRYFAQQNKDFAGYYAHLAIDAYNEIAALDYCYNKDMLGGKWELMIDMKPRDLPVFQQPVLPELPDDLLCVNSKPTMLQVTPLTETAGTPIEGDQMIALNAYNFTNKIDLETIEPLGHSGKVVRLPVARKITPKEPHLEYKIRTVSHGKVLLKVGTVPIHPVHGKTKLRYAIVIDRQEPVIVSTAAEFLTEKWAENTLRNQSLTISESNILDDGDHVIRIYALDEEILIDQLMVEFDLERKHYLIPTDIRRKK